MTRCQGSIIEAEFAERPRPEILDQDVGAGHQTIENRAALGMFEVERDAFLVAIDAQEVRALALEEGRAPRPRVIPLARLLDLDDARAHVSEEHRAIRSREDTGEVENHDSVEWRHNEPVIIVYAGSA